MENESIKGIKVIDIDNISSLERSVKECEAMMNYAMDNGKAVPPEALFLIEEFNNKGLNNIQFKNDKIKLLMNIHYKLSGIIEPAKPRSILLLANEKAKNNFWNFLGAVPLVRRIVLFSFILLFGFVYLCTTEQISSVNIQGDIFSLNSFDIFVVLMFYFTAAGLGAAFSILFEVNDFVLKGIFDPMYESSYWIRFVLGIISGIILASLVPIDLKVLKEESGVNAFAKPILAMLGGFSATLLYKILNRLVETIESLITGSPKDSIKTSVNLIKQDLEKEKYFNAMQLSSKLIKLQSGLKDGLNIYELKKR